MWFSKRYRSEYRKDYSDLYFLENHTYTIVLLHKTVAYVEQKSIVCSVGFSKPWIALSKEVSELYIDWYLSTGLLKNQAKTKKSDQSVKTLCQLQALWKSLTHVFK